MHVVQPFIENWPNYRTSYSMERPAITDFLASAEQYPERARLLLYLPFQLLQSPDADLHNAVRLAWHELINHRDVRENFHLGDVYEPSARPEPLGRVVKVAHLLPWLIQYGYFTHDDLCWVITNRHHDTVLCHSIFDTLPYMHDREILSVAQINQLYDCAPDLEPRHVFPNEPIHITPERRRWLIERNQYLRQPNLQLGKITGPFMDNFQASDAAKIVNCMSDHSILRFGGSRLKGYGRPDSDYDLSSIAIGEDPVVDPDYAHIVLCTVWASNCDSATLEAEQLRHAEAYLRLAADDPRRCRTIEKLEQDLLQYRLMHKGFPYAYGDLSIDTRDYPEMEGASAFYDARYRQAATELFLKYVYLPKI